MSETTVTSPAAGNIAEPPVRRTLVSIQPEKSERKNIKFVYRNLKLKLLDCRSGKPLDKVTVKEVLIAGKDDEWDEKEHVAVRYIGAPNWDIQANYIIPCKADFQPLHWRGFSKSNRRNLQKALNALGCNCGTPSKKFGKQGWKGFTKFQILWYDSHPEESKPEKLELKITLDWIKRIIEEYNKRFNRAVQFHLTALGYECDKDNGNWTDRVSKAAFHKWQERELGYKNPYDTFNATRNLTARKKLATKLLNARKNFTTYDGGLFYIGVPVARIKEGFKIRISFSDFAIINEKEGWRSDHEKKPTGFRIEWQDTQNVDSGKWGWRLKHPGEDSEATEFMSRLELTIPAAPDYDWKKLTDDEREEAGFSPFYTTVEDHPAFVFFALVWCQPVWDGIADPPKGFDINEDAYIKKSEERNRNFHVVTMYRSVGGSEGILSGKGYGLYEAFTTYPKYRLKKFNDDDQPVGWHTGIDIHAGVGDYVFAVHGGKVKLHNAVAGEKAGDWIYLSWKGKGRTSISLLHLDSFIAANNSHVQAGAIIGIAGRSGNLKDRYPGHCHLTMGFNNSLHKTPEDKENKACIPYNDSPLLFPCKCIVLDSDPDTEAKEVPTNCNFSNTYATNCWARAELKCPFMAGDDKKERRLQAQLHFLFRTKSGDGYTDPIDPEEGINGDFGSAVIGGKINLKSGDKVKWLEKYGVLQEGDSEDDPGWVKAASGSSNPYRKVKVGDIEGWIERDKLGAYPSPNPNKEYTLAEALDDSLLPGTAGLTKLAIYNFRRINTLLLTNSDTGTKYRANSQNFEIPDESTDKDNAPDKLNELAPITQPYRPPEGE